MSLSVSKRLAALKNGIGGPISNPAFDNTRSCRKSVFGKTLIEPNDASGIGKSSSLEEIQVKIVMYILQYLKKKKKYLSRK